MSTGKIKSTVAFKAFNRPTVGRFEVRRLTKAGLPSKARFTPVEIQLNTFNDIEKAEARRAALESLNSGAKYVVVRAS